MDSHEEQIAMDQFISDLLKEGVSYLDDKNLDRETIAYILEQLLEAHRNIINQLMQAREDEQQLRIEIKKKDRDCSNLQLRNQLIEEEYENLKILMSNQEMKYNNERMELSRSETSILEKLNFEEAEKKNLDEKLGQLQRENMVLNKNSKKMEAYCKALKEENEHLSRNLRQYEGIQDEWSQLKQENQYLEGLIAELKEEISQLMGSNQMLKNKIYELEYKITTSNTSSLVKPEEINEQLRSNNADVLKQIEQALDFDIFNADKKSLTGSCSQNAENWDQVSFVPNKSIMAPPKDIHKSEIATPMTVRNRHSSLTTIDLKMIRSSLGAKSYKKSENGQEVDNKPERVKIFTTFISNQPNTWRQKSKEKNLVEELQIEIQDLQTEVFQLKEEVQFLKQEKYFQKDALEAKLGQAEQVISNLNSRMRMKQMQHLEEMLALKQKMKEGILSTRERLENANKLCKQYEQIIETQVSAGTTTKTHEEKSVKTKPPRKNSANNFKIGIQNGCQTDACGIFKHNSSQCIQVQVQTQQFLVQTETLTCEIGVAAIVQINDDQTNTGSFSIEQKSVSTQIIQNNSCGVQVKDIAVDKQLNTEIFVSREKSTETQLVNHNETGIEAVVETCDAEMNTQHFQLHRSADIKSGWKEINKKFSTVQGSSHKEAKQNMKDSNQVKSPAAQNQHMHEILIPQFVLVPEKNAQHDLDYYSSPKNQNMNILVDEKHLKVDDNHLQSAENHLQSFKTVYYDVLRRTPNLRNKKQKFTFPNIQSYELTLKNCLQSQLRNLTREISITESKAFYLIKVVKIGQININTQDKMIIWSRGLLSQSEGGLLMSGVSKKVEGAQVCMLGNCEIFLDKDQLFVRRVGKRNYFFGDLTDGIWNITEVLGKGFV